MIGNLWRLALAADGTWHRYFAMDREHKLSLRCHCRPHVELDDDAEDGRVVVHAVRYPVFMPQRKERWH